MSHFQFSRSSFLKKTIKPFTRMRVVNFKNRPLLNITMILSLIFLFSGCAMVGPKSISMGRGVYNESINATEDEQMLLAIVKGRYEDTFSMLAVNGVAASVSFKANAGIEAGWGPNHNYDGNLVPFSGGIAYEENPTITYTPVQGEQYIRQLMTPIPLDILVLLMLNEQNQSAFLGALVKDVNNLSNPSFINSSSNSSAQDFQNFLTLDKELQDAGFIKWVARSNEEQGFRVLITGAPSSPADKIQEYLDLIGVDVSYKEGGFYSIPAYIAVKEDRSKKSSDITIFTRSTFELIDILRGAVDIPGKHLKEGLATSYPPPGLAGSKISVHSSKKRPESASLAVKHRGYWFYIEDNDLKTKAFYRMIRSLWSISLASATQQSGAPILTIPVGR